MDGGLIFQGDLRSFHTGLHMIHAYQHATVVTFIGDYGVKDSVKLFSWYKTPQWCVTLIR